MIEELVLPTTTTPEEELDVDKKHLANLQSLLLPENAQEVEKLYHGLIEDAKNIHPTRDEQDSNVCLAHMNCIGTTSVRQASSCQEYALLEKLTFEFAQHLWRDYYQPALEGTSPTIPDYILNPSKK